MGRMRMFAFVSIAYLASLFFTAVVAFFAVLFVAGPHGGVLPLWLHTPAILLACALVILVPVLVARRVWRSLSRPSSQT